MRWLATSGIIVTCEPVRDRMVAFTRSMSGATSATRRSIDGAGWLSKGTTTAKGNSPQKRTREHRNAMLMEQEYQLPQAVRGMTGKRRCVDAETKARRAGTAPTPCARMRCEWRCSSPATTKRPPSADVDRRFPRGPARGADLRLRQQFDRRHDARPRGRPARIVRRETRQGKGNVVRRMFADVEADVYVLVDGDATYDAPSAPRHDRRSDREPPRHGGRRARRPGRGGLPARPPHRQLAADRVRRPPCSASAFSDILSGYRVFSRRFVKSFPVLSGGFEIETELTSPCARTRSAGRRDRDALLRAAGRLGIQAQHLARRLPDSLDHLPAVSQSERPLNFFLGDRRRRWPIVGRRLRHSGLHDLFSRPASCRACRPPCSRPA